MVRQGNNNITIGQISTFLALVVGLIGSVKYLSNELQKHLKNTLKPLNDSILNLDKSQCKNFLVRFLADVEQGNKLDEVEKEREILKEQAINEGKPAEIASKMVEGRIRKYYEEIYKIYALGCCGADILVRCIEL